MGNLAICGSGLLALTLLGAGTLLAQAPNAIAFDPISSQILGVSPFVIAVQASSLIPVGFASSTPAVCRNSDDLVMLLSAGTCSIQASSAAVAPVTRSFTVSRANPAGTFVSAAG